MPKAETRKVPGGTVVSSKAPDVAMAKAREIAKGDMTRVEVKNSTTIMVWNSKEQRQRMQERRKGGKA